MRPLPLRQPLPDGELTLVVEWEDAEATHSEPTRIHLLRHHCNRGRACPPGKSQRFVRSHWSGPLIAAIAELCALDFRHRSILSSTLLLRSN
jgi:hypothetical protein